MRLILERPLVVFDTETTGTDPTRDRIVEIALVRIRPDGARESLVRRVNPGIPIPPDTSAIHGIRDEDVKDAPAFPAIADEVLAFIGDSDLAGYNVLKFDIPVLQNELRRAGKTLPLDGRSLVDPQKIFFLREPRDLSSAVRFYCGKELVGAHGALADAEATLDVLIGQLDRYPDLPSTVTELHDVVSDGLLDPEGRFRWREGEVVIGFGQHRGLRLKDVAAKTPEYLRWMISKEFSEAAKVVAREALSGKFPEPKSKR